MNYNTDLGMITLPEYGRTIQRLVKVATELPTKEERTRCAYSIIDVMGNLFPYLRDSEDYKHKLWDHLAIMSDFQLDIDYPTEPLNLEKLHTKPDRVKYPVSIYAERHYGNTVMLMIEKVGQTATPAERSSLIQLIANHMKKCYLLWNNTTIEDEKIIDDLYRLSRGEIHPDEVTFKLAEVRTMLEPKKRRQMQNVNNNNRNKGFMRNNNNGLRHNNNRNR